MINDFLKRLFTSKNSGNPELTSHEWDTAKRLQNEYWLYIVENAQTEPKITTIQNPYETFKNSIKKREVLDFRYVIENWK